MSDRDPMSIWAEHLAATEKLRQELFGPESSTAPPATSAPRKSPRCWHDQHTMRVDEESRVVTCSGCGSQIDPFKALGYLCRAGDRFRDLQQARKRLQNEVSELEAEEKRVKARLRRARKRLEEAESEESS